MMPHVAKCADLWVTIDGKKINLGGSILVWEPDALDVTSFEDATPKYLVNESVDFKPVKLKEYKKIDPERNGVLGKASSRKSSRLVVEMPSLNKLVPPPSDPREMT